MKTFERLKSAAQAFKQDLARSAPEKPAKYLVIDEAGLLLTSAVTKEDLAEKVIGLNTSAPFNVVKAININNKVESIVKSYYKHAPKTSQPSDQDSSPQLATSS